MTQQINLYNPAFRRVRDLLSAPLVATLAIACLVLVAVVAAWANWQAQQRADELALVTPQLAQQQAALTAMTRELAAPGRNAQLEADLAAATLALQGREDVVRALRNGAAGNPSGYAETLRALARQSTPGLWLTDFSIADGGGALTLRGRTLEPAQLPVFIKRLSAEKAFQGRQFAEISMQDSSLLAGLRVTAPADPAQHVVTPPLRGRFTEFVLAGGKDAGGEPGGGSKP